MFQQLIVVGKVFTVHRLYLITVQFILRIGEVAERWNKGPALCFSVRLFNSKSNM